MHTIYKELLEKGIQIYLDHGRLSAKAKKGSLTTELSRLIADNKNALIDYLQSTETVAIESGAIPSLPRDGRAFPLSHAQKRLWFLNQLYQTDSSYNVTLALSVKGQLDLCIVNKVFTDIIERHEILRTTYTTEGGIPYQYVMSMDSVSFIVQHSDIRDFPDDKKSQLVAELQVENSQTTFNLSHDLLFRCNCIQRSADEWVMLCVVHHIACDGWSMEVLNNEFLTLYRCYKEGTKSNLPELEIQYADYASWQSEHLHEGKIRKQLDYWKTQLHNIPPLHALPLDMPRPKIKTNSAELVTEPLPIDNARALKSLANKHRMTPFMLVHAAVALVLSQVCRQQDIIVGTAVANRPRTELNNLIGFFVNNLVLRVNTGKDSLSDYLDHVREVNRQAQIHQNVPFESIVDELKAPRNSAHSPLFQVLVTTEERYLEQQRDKAKQLEGLSFSAMQSDNYAAKFDLIFGVSLHQQGGSLNILYDDSLFRQDTVKNLLTRLSALLKEFCDLGENTHVKLSELNGFEALQDSNPQIEQDTHTAKEGAYTELASESKIYIAPSNDIEQGLVEIWAELLRKDPESVSTSANFFELGGYSLLIVRLMLEIRRRFDVELNLQQVFDSPTLSALSAEIQIQGQAVSYPPIQVRQGEGPLWPLSYAQQRLWFIDNLQGCSPEYNMPLAFYVSGELDIEIAERTFLQIINRHEILRTTYEEVNGEARQRVVAMSDVSFSITRKNFDKLEDKQQREAVDAYLAAESALVFNLSSDLMLRVHYLHLSAARGVLFVNLHHIASDGWSLDILTREFHGLYKGNLAGKDSFLKALPIQYADYALWQSDQLGEEVLSKQLTYWESQLSEIPALHSLPLSYQRPDKKQYQGDVLSSQLSAAVSEALQKIASHHHLTPFMLLHGALSLVLSRYSNSTDIVVGTPVANRLQKELSLLIGFFVNTLVLRTDTAHGSIGEYFRHIRAVHREAQVNQDVPFEQLVERLKIKRNRQHTPLFQIMLTTASDFGMTSDVVEDKINNVKFSPYGSTVVQAKFDLDIHLSLNSEGVTVRWTYDTSLFSESAIARLNDHFCRLLTSISEIGEANVPLHRLEMLSQSEARHLREELNDTYLEYPSTTCLQDLFEAQVATNPEAVAAVFEEQSITYSQLNARANHLAHFLRNTHNVKPDALVGLCLDRSLESVVGILGILKAGGAYVPLDPDYPKERLEYMLADADSQLVLVDAVGETALGETALSKRKCVLLGVDGFSCGETLQKWVFDSEINNPDKSKVGLRSSNLAYVMYTSGSTGKPKGVMIEHKSVVNSALSQRADLVGISSSSRVLQFSSISFDASVYEWTMALCSGGQLYIAGRQQRRDVQVLSKLMVDAGITHTLLPPALMMSLPYRNDYSLDCLLVGGESSNPEVIAKWQGSYNVVNAYGPTESTVCCTQGQFNAAIPNDIGRPLVNHSVFVLDGQQQLSPGGVLGELCVGGAGLARGYLNRPELTAERFIENPYYDERIVNSSKRLYRTGDIVRYLDNGNLEYIGRRDDQVKIRGFRIELGEVEAQLQQLEEVESALVIARELAGSRQLIGYIQNSSTLDEHSASDVIAKVRQKLGQTLPEYMVPALLIGIDSWPLTASGKIDTRALPEPESAVLQKEYVAPQNDTELALVEIWSELLQIPAQTISTGANFFELGGHSLLVLKMRSEMSKLNYDLNIEIVYSAFSLEEMATQISPITSAQTDPKNEHAKCTPLYIDTLTEQDWAVFDRSVPGGKGNVQDVYPLSPLQRGIHYVHTVNQHHDPYVTLMPFEFESNFSLEQFISTMRVLVNRYDILRTIVVWRNRPDAIQVVCKELPFQVMSVDDHGEHDTEALFDRIMQENQTMDLESAPLLQLQVYPLSKAGCYLSILKTHHLILDHISLEILFEEFSVIQAKKADTLPVPMQYREFVMAALQKDHKDAEAFFSSTLSSIEQPTLPFGLCDVTGDGKSIRETALKLDVQQSESIRKLSKQFKVSPASFFHLMMAKLLGTCCGMQDVVFGTVLSGRMTGNTDIQRAVGMLINTLPIRINMVGLSAQELLVQTSNSLSALHPYEQVPLSTALSACGVQGQASLFSACINYRHNRPVSVSTVGVDKKIVQPGFKSRERTNYPFNLTVNDNGVSQPLSIDLQIDASVDVQRVAQYATNAIDSLIILLTTGDKRPLNQVNIMTPGENEMLLETLRQSPGEPLASGTIQTKFEQQVLANPTSIALVSGSQSITYDNLNQSANRIARYLIEKCDVKIETRVGIYVGRSPDWAVAILAVLKAGGAYVPLDPTAPKARVNRIIEEAEIHTLLVHEQTSDALPDFTGKLLNIEKIEKSIISSEQCIKWGENLNNDDSSDRGNQLAYVIFTSGSSGSPKGVMIEHQGALNMCIQQKHLFSLSSNCKVLQFASLAFDAAVSEWMMALLSGAQLHFCSEEQRFSGDQLGELLYNSGITHLTLPPTFLEILPFREDYALEALIVAGEACSTEMAAPWASSYAMYNAYGPTEASVCATVGRIEINTPLHIGRAIGNLSQYVLSKDGDLIPQGVAGELYIGGVGLARGYLNQPDLTREKFIENPYFQIGDTDIPQRLYKTGDGVSYTPTGELLFLGRSDEQVKIRGFRVELGEISDQLNTIKEIDSSVVQQSNQQLIAYVKLASTCTLKAHELFKIATANLTRALPSYMLPSRYIVVTSWPLISNGKIDKRALLESYKTQESSNLGKIDTTFEREVRDIWSAILNRPPEQIGKFDSFINLGGHSLMLMRLLQDLQLKYDVHLEIRELIENSLLSEQADLISRKKLRGKINSLDESDLEEMEF